jgi:hypothetical protein
LSGGRVTCSCTIKVEIKTISIHFILLEKKEMLSRLWRLFSFVGGGEGRSSATLLTLESKGLLANMPRDLVVLLLQQTVDGMYLDAAVSLRGVCKMFQQVLDAIPADRKRFTSRHTYFYGRHQWMPFSLLLSPDYTQFVFRNSDDPLPFLNLYNYLNARYGDKLFSAATMKWRLLRLQTLAKINFAPPDDDNRLPIEYYMQDYRTEPPPTFNAHGNGIITVRLRPMTPGRMAQRGPSPEFYPPFFQTSLLNQEVQDIHSHFFTDIRQILLERTDVATLKVTFSAALSPRAKELFEWWMCHPKTSVFSQ